VAIFNSCSVMVRYIKIKTGTLMLNFLRTGVNLKKDARGDGPSNETVVTCLWRYGSSLRNSRRALPAVRLCRADQDPSKIFEPTT